MKYESQYSNEEDPSFPVVSARLLDPLSSKSIEVNAKVDTGFSGSLLITFDDYLKLGLQLYEEPEKAVTGRLATGASVRLRSSRGIFALGNDHINCHVYTTPVLLRALIGRELLKKWRMQLDGRKQILKIVP